MGLDALLVAAVTALLSWAGTAYMRRLALASGLLDRPNARSSHRVPTPRGGGVAIVLAANCGLLALGARHRIDSHLLVALLGGGLAVALVGFADDRRSVPPGIRLLVHLSAAIWTIAWLGGLPPLRLGNTLVALHLTGSIIAVIAVVWTLNLFNFMDGIDGIAASEAIFIAWAGAMLNAATGPADGSVVYGAVIGAACLGFLVWNWPPARIFMGDVGSGYVGYVLATLALAGARDRPVALPAWTILGGVFFVDATVTLLRRWARGEKIYQAHRSHAYQHLARRLGRHGPVTVMVLAVNLLWLLPCAWLATRMQNVALWIVLAALLPLGMLLLALGSGRKES